LTQLRRVPTDSGLGRAVLVLSDNIRRETGHEPPTCPWTCYSDPVVGAGIGLANRLEKFSIDVDDQPAVVVAAYELINRTQNHLEAKDRKVQRAQREAEARMREASKPSR